MSRKPGPKPKRDDHEILPEFREVVAKKKRNLTSEEWEEISSLYGTGDYTTKDLAEQFDVTPDSITRKMGTLGVKKGSLKEQAAAAVNHAVDEEAALRTKEIMKQAFDTKKDHYKYAEALSKLVFVTVANAIRAGEDVSIHKDKIITFKHALAACEIGRLTRWQVLGLDQDLDVADEIPVLIVEEMTDEEALQQKSQIDKELGIDLEQVEAIAASIMDEQDEA
tara:strand:- start:3675 stop:4343 length:669 start_codon:yes stop_codon:yes gene_type:complete